MIKIDSQLMKLSDSMPMKTSQRPRDSRVYYCFKSDDVEGELELEATVDGERLNFWTLKGLKLNASELWETKGRLTWLSSDVPDKMDYVSNDRSVRRLLGTQLGREFKSWVKVEYTKWRH